MKCARTIKWEEIIDAGDWDRLLEQMIERHVFTAGFRINTRQTRHLGERVGLELNVDEEPLKQLESSEYPRNVFVRNGGRASQEAHSSSVLDS